MTENPFISPENYAQLTIGKNTKYEKLMQYYINRKAQKGECVAMV